MRRLAVFCGSHAGVRPEYQRAAAALGHELARREVALVYGGGNVGLMGVLADATLAAGGEVIGVIPRFLIERELGHRGVTELRIVESMHERKATIASLAEAFVALPGGIGTLEEIFEVWTWNLLGLHVKACGLLNVGGYFDPLIAFLDRTVDEGFVGRGHRDILAVEDDPGRLLAALESRVLAIPPAKWTERI